jgi:DNA-binding transcriptional regulator YdaS (Cro superfamily)
VTTDAVDMLSVMKTDEQRRARELRALGWSVKEIERQLGVSRSSVSLWVRDVELSPPARARLVERTRLGPIVTAKLKAERARAVRRDWQEDGRRRARGGDAGYMAGCMLYWAEGAKARNSLCLVNSDPDVLVFFARFLRTYFAVPDDRIRVRCNLFADHLAKQREIEDFWLTRLALPRACLGKTTVNTYSKYSQKKRRNKLEHGTTTLVVNSTQLVQTIFGSIQEYGGFERPEWLD